jgi:hypothetical protein
MKQIDQMCICGHRVGSHEHHRTGSDCALCPSGTCARFRAISGLSGWLRKKLAKTMNGAAIKAWVDYTRRMILT